MQVQLQQVLPHPLKKNDRSEVWNKDWNLAPGEQLFLRAASGKGKSSLIHILYGLRNDYSGQVFWDNKDIKNNNPEDWALLRQQQLSIVFQDLRLFDELSVLENIAIKQNLTADTDLEKSKDRLRSLGFSEKQFDQKAGTLSYGEKQRVAIVRALVQPFSWLLLDEPFSHLDVENIEKATLLMQQVIKENNAGMIMVDLEDNNWFKFTKKMVL